MNVTIIFFTNTILLTILSSFVIGTSGMRINRIVNNIPLYLFNDSIVPIDEEENINPHFDIKRLEKNINNYLILSLENLSNDYEISYFPFKVVKSDLGVENYYLDTSNCIKNVQLHFTCAYYHSFKINKYFTYKINQKGAVKDEY